MARSSNARLAATASLSLAAALFLPSRARAQCTVEGSISLTSVRAPSHDAAPITQAMRVTFRGTRATVEGTSPLAFRTVIQPENAQLFIASGGFSNGVLAVSAGARVRVRDTRGADVIATVHASDELEARDVVLPCSSLTATATTASAATQPEFPASRRWTSDSIVNVRPRCTAHGCEGLVVPTPAVRGPLRCTGREGSVRCAPSPHAGRCQPIGDGSSCGYHPVRESLRLFRRPNARSESVQVVATRDVAFVDDDGRPGWLRVASRGMSANALVVRGWVRMSDVRWAQEVPPSARNIGMGMYGTITGHARAVGTRVGFVTLPRDSLIVDENNTVIARVADALWCSRAEHLANATHVRVALPGASGLSDSARVAVTTDVHWVQSCAE